MFVSYASLTKGHICTLSDSLLNIVSQYMFFKFADGNTGHHHGGPAVLPLQSQDHQNPGMPQRYIYAMQKVGKGPTFF
jgi:hypothetical protein